MRDIVKNNKYLTDSKKYFAGRFRFLNFQYTQEIGVWILYFLVTILATWPLIFYINSYIPGVGNDSGDSFHFVWDLWWIKKSVLNGWDIFYTDYIFYPQGVSLVFHTLILGQAILCFPWLLVFGEVVVINIFYLFSIWFAAVLTYRLVMELCRNRKAAFLSGFVYGFMPYVFAHSLGHFNLTTIWPFPALGLVLFNFYKNKKWIWLLIAGLILGFLFLNDFQYFLFGMMFVVLFFGYFFINNQYINRISIVLGLLAISVISFLIAYPLLIKVLGATYVYMPTSLLSEVVYWSGDVLSFFVPSFLHPIFGGIGQFFVEKYNFPGVESVLYVGYTLGVVVLLSFFINIKNDKDRLNFRFWQMITLVFLIMVLGPLLKYADNTEFKLNDVVYNIGLPYVWIYKLPYLSIARVPTRYFAVFMLGISVVAGYSMSYFFNRVSKQKSRYRNKMVWMLFLLLMTLMVFEYLNWPMRLQSVKIPDVYEEIVKDREQFTILELPLWWTSGHRSEGDVKTIIQYYQTYHEKNILNGSVSRVPDALFDYYLNIPGIKYLENIESVQPDVDDSDKNKVISIWKNDLGIKYIVLHKNYYQKNEYNLMVDYLEDILNLKVFYDDKNERSYML